MSVNLATTTGPHPSIRRGGSDSKKRPDMLLPLSPTSPCGSGLSGKREAGRSAPSLRFLQDTPNYVDAEGERDVDPAQLPPPTLILPHVFLGSQFDAVDPDRLKAPLDFYLFTCYVLLFYIYSSLFNATEFLCFF